MTRTLMICLILGFALLACNGDEPSRKPGRSPLHEAALYGNAEDLKNALTGLVNTEQPTSEGNRPLHLAAWGGNYSTVEALLERGVDPNARAKDNYVALHFLSLPMTDGTPCSATHGEVAELMIVKGALVDLRSDSGRTPLHLAATWGCVDVARALLDHGADPRATDDDARSPLSIATERNDRTLLEFFAKAGAP